jgi:hypothetical protein
MNKPHYARAVVALLAAYAVALQTLLLAVGVPVAGVSEFAGVFDTLPICSNAAGGHSLPADHDHDCPGACLSGCCGSAPLAPSSTAFIVVPPTEPFATAAFGSIPILPLRVAGAHRSRAPPLG